MVRSFGEFQDVSVREPLRQGDVIESVDIHASKWKRHLLVITADCDFANEKHRGRVTCVPLLSQDEYLMEFQTPKLQDRIIERATKQLSTLLAAAGAPAISSKRLREWPTEQDPEAIVAALGLAGSEASDAVRLFASLESIANLPSDLDGAVKRLVAAQVDIPNGKKWANAQRETLEALQSHFSNPPGDALFLSAIAPSLAGGYFVYMRHLEQVMQPDIAIGPTRTATTYRRLARLQDRFIHAVSQQFALVFMAIGLPREYEEIRNFHSDMLGDRYK